MTMAPGPFVLLQMCWQLSLGSIYSCIHKFPLGNLRARLLLPTLLEFPLGEILLIFSIPFQDVMPSTCLLYTSDAADDMQCVDLGGRRIIKK